MRCALLPLLALALAAALAPGVARAQPAPSPKPAPAAPNPQAEANRRASLDELFTRLAAAPDEDGAKGVATVIERRLERSGSDTADLLAQRAGQAAASDPSLAVELLDRVTQIRPGWAEGWNRRAAAFYRLDDPVRATMDLEEALRHEPRHWTAWTALGHVEFASGDKARALSAYRRALKIHPFLSDVKKAVDRLAPEIEGRDL